MCEPTTLMIAGMAMSAMQGIMQLQQSQQAAKAAEREGAYRNAQAQLQAGDELQAGDKRAADSALRARQLAGLSNATQGSSGGTAGAGTFGLLTSDIEEAGQRNVDADRLTAAQRANTLLQGGQLSQFAGENKASAIRSEGIAGALSSGANVATKWSAYSKATA